MHYIPQVHSPRRTPAKKQTFGNNAAIAPFADVAGAPNAGVVVVVVVLTMTEVSVYPRLVVTSEDPEMVLLGMTVRVIIGMLAFEIETSCMVTVYGPNHVAFPGAGFRGDADAVKVEVVVEVILVVNRGLDMPGVVMVSVLVVGSVTVVLGRMNSEASTKPAGGRASLTVVRKGRNPASCW